MDRYKIVVCRFPGNYQEHPASVNWVIKTLLQMKDDPRIESVEPISIVDTPITMSRNRAVRYAREDAKADYLLMIDADMAPDPQPSYHASKPFWSSSFDFMLSRRHEPCAIAAPYCGPSPQQCPYVFLWRNHMTGKPETHHDGYKLEMLTREEASWRAGIEEVAALPTGLILYDLRVFNDMTPPWFHYEYTDKYECKKGSTEDVVQTRDMTLAWYASEGKIGGKLWCNWDAWAHHVKLEHVPRPMPVGIDQIAASLKHAVEVGRQSTDRLVMVGGGGIDGLKSTRERVEAQNQNCSRPPEMIWEDKKSNQPRVPQDERLPLLDDNSVPAVLAEITKEVAEAASGKHRHVNGQPSPLVPLAKINNTNIASLALIGKPQSS